MKIRIPNTFSVLMVTTILLINPTMSQSPRASQQSLSSDSGFLDEKRSCIQTVDGYAYLSEDMTLAESRKAAFLNAKRQAVEMAKSYVSSHTKVVNLETEYDVIWMESEGAVRVLEQKDLGVEKNTRYHVWIKAEVEYSIAAKDVRTGEKVMGDKNALLTVKIWTKKHSYRRGEIIQIYMQGNRDYYARLVDITPDGNIIQLLPNDFRRNNFFKAGKVYKIPDTGDRFAMRASPPYGQDRIVVYASEAPLGSVEMQAVGQGLNQFSGSVTALSAKTRGIQIEYVEAGNPQAASFYEGIWSFHTSQ